MDLKRWKIFASLSPTFAVNLKSVHIICIDAPQSSLGKSGQDIPRRRAGVMVMKNDDVYSIALTSEEFNLLGVAQSENLRPLVPVKIDAVCGLGIRAISSGLAYVAALTLDGRVYAWGSEFIGGKYQQAEPQFISGELDGKTVVQVACGRVHTLALTQEGELYGWGRNDQGQLGIGNQTDELQPVKVSGLNGFDKKIVSVACGGWTSFAIDNEGNVWSWGNKVCGALGFVASGSQLSPRKIALISNIEKIAAGKHHVLALSSKKQLYFWGQHTVPEICAQTPVLINVPNVADIGIVRGCSLSAFQTTDGKVHFWGYAYGNLTRQLVATGFATLDELFSSLESPVMLRPAELNSELPSVLIRKLRLSFDDHETGDIKFKVDGKSVYAHKMFLKLRSEHFKRMFANNWKEENGHESVVEISGFTYPAFRTFMLYLYTEVIEPPPETAEDAIELFKIGDYYGEEELKECCEHNLKLLITADSLEHVYSVAVQYNNKVLHNTVLDFVIPNFDSIVKSEGYKKMADELKNRLIEDMANEGAFAGMKRMRYTE